MAMVSEIFFAPQDFPNKYRDMPPGILKKARPEPAYRPASRIWGAAPQEVPLIRELKRHGAGDHAAFLETMGMRVKNSA